MHMLAPLAVDPGMPLLLLLLLLSCTNLPVSISSAQLLIAHMLLAVLLLQV